MLTILHANHWRRRRSELPRIGPSLLVALLVLLFPSEVAWGRSLCSAPQEKSATTENAVSVTFIVEGMMKSKSGAT